MATFLLWQRVRVISAPAFPGAVGREATVTACADQDGYYGLRVDDYPSGHSSGEFRCWACHIAPLQPERNQVIAWSACCWQPEHLREIA